MKYKRLQVGPVWLRTLLEIALMLLALTVTSTMVVSYYERSYYASTQSQAAEANAQLAHSLEGIVDTSLLLEEGERLEYVKSSYYQPLLDGCFVQGDVLNSCAVYLSTEDGSELFVKSPDYPELLTEEQLADLELAFGGERRSASYGRADMTFIPYFDQPGNCVAVLAVSSEYRDSLDYNSIVSDRLRKIVLIGGGVIVVYYIINGLVTARNKRKGAQV